MADIIDLDAPQFPLSEAARASGWPLATLRNKYTNGEFHFLDIDRATDKAGSANRVSARTIIQLALARRLSRYGLRPSEAFVAALKFSFIGEPSVGVWIDPASSTSPGPETSLRQPGRLFDPEKYFTFLVWQPERGARIAPIERLSGTIAEELVISLLSDTEQESRQLTDALIVNVGPIYNAVIELLTAEQAAAE